MLLDILAARLRVLALLHIRGALHGPCPHTEPNQAIRLAGWPEFELVLQLGKKLPATTSLSTEFMPAGQFSAEGKAIAKREAQ